MIEIIIKQHLEDKLTEPIFLEKPSSQTGTYIVFEKTSGGETNHLPSGTFAFQSYAPSLYQSALLNEKVKEAVKSLIELDAIRGLSLNSDYKFPDTTTKEYRYQAVFDIRYY